MTRLHGSNGAFIIDYQAFMPGLCTRVYSYEYSRTVLVYMYRIGETAQTAHGSGTRAGRHTSGRGETPTNTHREGETSGGHRGQVERDGLMQPQLALLVEISYQNALDLSSMDPDALSAALLAACSKICRPAQDRRQGRDAQVWLRPSQCMASVVRLYGVLAARWRRKGASWH